MMNQSGEGIKKKLIIVQIRKTVPQIKAYIFFESPAIFVEAKPATKVPEAYEIITINNTIKGAVSAYTRNASAS